MTSFTKNQSLRDFQTFVEKVYAIPDDRLYSIWDLLAHQQRFTMRALKGIRKNSPTSIKLNILIALSWTMAIANRLHIDIDDALWKRFPRLCSYCGKSPCTCKTIKQKTRRKIPATNRSRPKTLADIQAMFLKVYPPEKRTLQHSGIHLAEEMGEVSEALHNYLGQHRHKQFDEVKIELADYVSCIFGLANSAGIDIAKELSQLFRTNCHICHKAPCTCGFTKVANYKAEGL